MNNSSIMLCCLRQRRIDRCNDKGVYTPGDMNFWVRGIVLGLRNWWPLPDYIQEQFCLTQLCGKHQKSLSHPRLNMKWKLFTPLVNFKSYDEFQFQTKILLFLYPTPPPPRLNCLKGITFTAVHTPVCLHRIIGCRWKNNLFHCPFF